MDRNTYSIILYDFYKNLLTEKEQSYFEDYYFNNLSLAEISENIGVSRNNVHKKLKLIEMKLNDYEMKLNLYEKSKEMENIISLVDNEDIIQKLKDLNL